MRSRGEILTRIQRQRKRQHHGTGAVELQFGSIKQRQRLTGVAFRQCRQRGGIRPFGLRDTAGLGISLRCGWFFSAVITGGQQQQASRQCDPLTKLLA
ncbi:hypothetical protein D3C81_1583030 [compost metagenome]